MFHLGITVRILFAWTSWCLRQLTTYLYQMRKMISSLTAKLTTTTDLSRKMGKRKEINLAAKAFSAFFVFFLFVHSNYGTKIIKKCIMFMSLTTLKNK